MTPLASISIFACASVLGVAAALTWQLRRRNMHRWLPGYLLDDARRRFSRPRLAATQPIHILLCIADHFEPHWGNASAATADARVAAWTDNYSRLLSGFRDSDNRPPRHTFFYPIDQYHEPHVDALA